MALTPLFRDYLGRDLWFDIQIGPDKYDFLGRNIVDPDDPDNADADETDYLGRVLLGPA